MMPAQVDSSISSSASPTSQIPGVRMRAMGSPMRRIFSLFRSSFGVPILISPTASDPNRIRPVEPSNETLRMSAMVG